MQPTWHILVYFILRKIDYKEQMLQQNKAHTLKHI